MRRRHRMTALAATLAVMASACSSDRVTFEDLLRDAVVQTTLLPRSYTFVDEVRDGATTEVDVVIEDDFRYRATWSVDGQPVYEEAVRDDAIAARAFDVDLVLATIGVTIDVDLEGIDAADLPGLTDADGEPGAPTDEATEAPTNGPTEEATEPGLPPELRGSVALSNGEWVVDQVGAPTFSTRVTVDDLGVDPVVDAVGVLTLVATILDGAPGVLRWDDSRIEYDPDNDPFRAPDEEAEDPEIRYDLFAQPIINRASVTAQNTQAATPDMLRQTSVYVRNGVITEVRLRIDASATFEAIEKAYELSSTGSDEERAQRALVAVNEARAALGDDPIVARDISVVFAAVGEPQVVDVPKGEVASLRFLARRGSLTGEIPVEPTPEPTATSTDDANEPPDGGGAAADDG